MRPGVSFLDALRVLALSTVVGRCPSCRSHSMFRGVFELYERCPNCGVRYQVESGAWLGAIAIGYAVGAVVAVILGAIELTWHPIAEAGLDPLWAITIVSVVVTVPAYRPAKGFWFALLWLFGFTEDAPEAPPGDH